MVIFKLTISRSLRKLYFSNFYSLKASLKFWWWTFYIKKIDQAYLFVWKTHYKSYKMAFDWRINWEIMLPKWYLSPNVRPTRWKRRNSIVQLCKPLWTMIWLVSSISHQHTKLVVENSLTCRKLFFNHNDWIIIF